MMMMMMMMQGQHWGGGGEDAGEYQLPAGVALDAKGSYSRTALHTAAAAGHEETAPGPGADAAAESDMIIDGALERAAGRGQPELLPAYIAASSRTR